MFLGVPKERDELERRVALTPQVVLRLTERRHTVRVETGAGEDAGLTDDAYRDAGAQIVSRRAEALDADVVFTVAPLDPDAISELRRDGVVIGFLDPFVRTDCVGAMADHGVTAFAMEAVPRTTQAQGMDALSSQATAAGYAAVLAGAGTCTRFFPMLTTAAGTIPPAKVLVLGAGVAGLQAIATARRLGAVVSAYDIRPEVAEQIRSLGATFVAAPTDESAAAATGYAKEVSDDTQRRQQDALGPHVAEADVVVATAQIPGAAAPLLVSREMVERMRPGSVIVDVAAPTGGNCEVTRVDEQVDHGGVIVVGPSNLASRVAFHASQMYARNVTALLALMDVDGELVVDLDNDILAGTCITHQGRVVHPVVRRAMDRESGQELEQ